MPNTMHIAVILLIAINLMSDCNRSRGFTNVAANQTNAANINTANNQRSPLHNPIEKSDFSNIPTVSYCELIKNPSKYDHKIVRLRAIYFTSFEQTYIYDETCDAGKPPTAPEKVPAETWAEWDRYLVSKGDSEEAILNRELNGFGRKDVTLIGKFNSTNDQTEANEPNRFGHLNCCQFQFKIMQLEKIVKQKD